MFSCDQLNGLLLPEKTLCLTFDDGPGETTGDGPGPKTLGLAEYLAGQNIFATFFMVGACVARHPQMVQAVAALGHMPGNHTYTHPNMPRCFEAGGDLVGEITRTTELMINCIPGNEVFFRAPFGEWEPALSNMLNQQIESAHLYKGPFYWDIDGRDWAFWQEGRSAEGCADAYLREIVRVDRGIVLMHDSTADIGEARMNNRTLETIRILIPRLKRLGYQFVRIDEIGY
jgi:peptidoglycan/xylan/chitin deacetylase (PgdA/CDA1 family)